jgi:hypothetical protein
MPCRDYDDDHFHRTLNGQLEAELATTKHKLDNVTRLLCAVMSRIDTFEFGTTTDPLAPRDEIEGLQGWWTDHQEMDRRRREQEAAEEAARQAEIERERLVEEALASLSPEQKKAMQESGVLTTSD